MIEEKNRRNQTVEQILAKNHFFIQKYPQMKVYLNKIQRGVNKQKDLYLPKGTIYIYVTQAKKQLKISCFHLFLYIYTQKKLL